MSDNDNELNQDKISSHKLYSYKSNQPSSICLQLTVTAVIMICLVGTDLLID